MESSPPVSSAPPRPSPPPRRGPGVAFYVVAVVAVVALVLFWREKHRRGVDLLPHTRERDKDFSFVVDAYGFKYQGHTGNIIDECALLYGAWEKDHVFFVRDYLKNLNEPNAVVIDVGANTGHHALFYSRHAARVLAFEPFPPVIERFRKNLALNPHVTNVELLEVGLGDADAELPFAAPVEENHGQGTFRADRPQNTGMKQFERKLRIVVGDSFLEGKLSGPVAFIKVDIEGFEESALKGLRKTIENHRPLLEVEVTPPPFGTIDSFDRLKGLFPDGYEFFVLARSPDGWSKGKYSLEKFDPAYVTKAQIELVACPKERVKLLPGR